jgi:RNA-directed DNA polymerase
MFEFDVDWSARSRNRGITYTRYADDLYFSTNRLGILEPLLEELRLQIRLRKSPALGINDEKTIFTSRKRRRAVTGLILTPEGRVSLGRKKKRYIRSLIFQLTRRQLSDKECNYLRGFISFAMSVEPTFIQSLEAKFGADVLATANQGKALRPPPHGESSALL